MSSEESALRVVKRYRRQVDRLEDEAIMQMEMLNHTFFVYLNMETDSVNIVYRRDDGNYGLLETSY